ncbi:hypothetical protein MCOR18_006144 [Pyricularia oryzae]|nr:hypothetical protein MCOR20_008057 [Pyricularia oryzae]KAI6478628.1 hypothetical protein MCOR18_006144 [Pyricularia oryzae]KAI6537470.1 hypothetical protein MCOR16_002063 [Pyricularia oryzae]
MRSEFAPASDPEANQWLDIMIGQGTTLAKDLLQMGNRQRLFRRNRGTGPRGRGRRDTTACTQSFLRVSHLRALTSILSLRPRPPDGRGLWWQPGQQVRQRPYGRFGRGLRQRALGRVRACSGCEGNSFRDPTVNLMYQRISIALSLAGIHGISEIPYKTVVAMTTTPVLSTMFVSREACRIKTCSHRQEHGRPSGKQWVECQHMGQYA